MSGGNDNDSQFLYSKLKEQLIERAHLGLLYRILSKSNINFYMQVNRKYIRKYYILWFKQKIVNIMIFFFKYIQPEPYSTCINDNYIFLLSSSN